MAEGSMFGITKVRTRRSRSRRLSLGLAALGLVASGCSGGGGEVDVTYRQLGYFTDYQATAGSVSTPGGSGVYVLYRITGVDNGSGGDFTLNPNRFSADGSKEHAAHEGPLLGDSLLPSVPVEAGESESDDLGCIVLVARVEDAEKTFGNFAGTTVPVDLAYEKTGDTTVNAEREDTNTGFTFLQSPGPEAVQKECREGRS